MHLNFLTIINVVFEVFSGVEFLRNVETETKHLFNVTEK